VLCYLLIFYVISPDAVLSNNVNVSSGTQKNKTLLNLNQPNSCGIQQEIRCWLLMQGKDHNDDGQSGDSASVRRHRLSTVYKSASARQIHDTPCALASVKKQSYLTLSYCILVHDELTVAMLSFHSCMTLLQNLVCATAVLYKCVSVCVSSHYISHLQTSRRPLDPLLPFLSTIWCGKTWDFMSIIWL